MKRIAVVGSFSFLAALPRCGKSKLVRENLNCPHLRHNRRTFPQDAQKGRPARPQPKKAPEA
jgi:hypothetical protein